MDELRVGWRGWGRPCGGTWTALGLRAEDGGLLPPQYRG